MAIWKINFTRYVCTAVGSVRFMSHYAPCIELFHGWRDVAWFMTDATIGQAMCIIESYLHCQERHIVGLMLSVCISVWKPFTQVQDEFCAKLTVIYEMMTSIISILATNVNINEPEQHISYEIYTTCSTIKNLFFIKRKVLTKTKLGPRYVLLSLEPILIDLCFGAILMASISALLDHVCFYIIFMWNSQLRITHTVRVES